MNELSFAFYDTENGWATDEITLTGNIAIEVCLKKPGITVIKRRNDDDDETPKVYISKRTDNLRLKVTGESKNSKIQILTSEEPKHIRYANIW